jgi:hypothetical protein
MDLSYLMGTRLGKCERWMLETAPDPDDEPQYINRDYDNRRASDHQHRIVIRAIKKLNRIGLVEVHRKLYELEREDKDGDLYKDGRYSRYCLNHAFWANHVRLTPLGKVVEDEITRLDYMQPISWKNLLPEIKKN